MNKPMPKTAKEHRLHKANASLWAIADLVLATEVIFSKLRRPDEQSDALQAVQGVLFSIRLLAETANDAVIEAIDAEYRQEVA